MKNSSYDVCNLFGVVIIAHMKKISKNILSKEKIIGIMKR